MLILIKKVQLFISLKQLDIYCGLEIARTEQVAVITHDLVGKTFSRKATKTPNRALL